MSTAPIRLFWWRWQHPRRLNFGDEVTAPLLERLTGRRIVWSPLSRCDAIGAGSILQMAVRTRASHLPIVWGSGFIRPPVEGEPTITDSLLAVRGELSRDRLDPSVRSAVRLGDPGLLAPHLLDRPVRKRYAVGFVPHYKDAADPVVTGLLARNRSVRRIDVAWSPEEVAREIAACEVVLSSSMHGLIFSDALGVPNLHVQLGDKLIGGTYKFEDYNTALEREHVAVGQEDVRDLGTDDLMNLVQSRYREPQGLRHLQKELIGVLPW